MERYFIRVLMFASAFVILPCLVCARSGGTERPHVLLSISREDAKGQYPPAPVGTIKGFTLAQCRPVQFNKRPDAAQLYRKVMQLYASFQSAAASYRGVVTVRKHGLAGKAQKSESTGEFRSKGPYRTMKSEWRTVAVTGPKMVYVYFRKNNTYIAGKRSELSNSGNPVAEWLGLIPNPDMHVKMHLLPDARLGKTTTYVLEINSLPKYNEGLSVVTRFYLGKSDLLPRKTISTIKPSITQEYDFSGFAANLPLSDDLFPEGPPPGAKLAPPIPKNQ